MPFRSRRRSAGGFMNGVVLGSRDASCSWVRRNSTSISSCRNARFASAFVPPGGPGDGPDARATCALRRHSSRDSGIPSRESADFVPESFVPDWGEMTRSTRWSQSSVTGPDCAHADTSSPDSDRLGLGLGIGDWGLGFDRGSGLGTRGLGIRDSGSGFETSSRIESTTRRRLGSTRGFRHVRRVRIRPSLQPRGRWHRRRAGQPEAGTGSRTLEAGRRTAGTAIVATLGSHSRQRGAEASFRRQA